MGEKIETLVKTLKHEDFKLSRKIFGDRWQIVQQKMSYPFEALKKINDYDKPLKNLENYYSSLTNENPGIETTNKIIEEINL